MGTRFLPLFRCITSKRLVVFAVALFAMAIMTAPASAQDNVPFFCNGSSGTTCTLFQLDGSTLPSTVANTCVGTENNCPNNENPVWPADWDALFYPGLATGGPFPIIGTPGGPYSFNLPWGAFGSFSGVIKSTLVTPGTSTILKKGTKNIDDISLWTVATQNSPPKDAYVAGTIASYVAPPGGFYGGHQLIYLGSTRFAPNGSASIGIWFFQQNVQICQSGPNAGSAMCVDGTATAANHQSGDLFLFLTFGGSGNATIQAAKWVGNGTSGSLGPATNLTTCPAANDIGCAVTNENNSITLGSNSGPQLPGFGFNVSGPGFAGFPNGVVPAGQFQETGVDFNAIFGGQAPCFSSVMFASVTSGSSPSTASMKSILLGSFNTCAINVTKSCGAGIAHPATGTVTFPISGDVENTGGGSTTNLSITDTFNNNSQALDSGSLSCTCTNSGCTITNTDCSTVTLNPGGTVHYTASITTSSNGGDDIVHALMGGSGGGSASADSNTATCNPLSFNTGITISKDCTPGARLVAVGTNPTVLEVQVSVGGTVTNTSSGSLTLSNVQFYDCVGASFNALSGTCASTTTASCATNGGTLRGPFNLANLGASGTATDHESWSDSYFPSVVPACGNTSLGFSDQVLVQAQCTSQFCGCPTVENVASKTCPLCPGPSCTP
jgi:hypothetical protein